MRPHFILGHPPRHPLLDQEPGWTPVPGYGDSVPFTLRAIGVGLAYGAMVAAAWLLMLPDSLAIETPSLSAFVLCLLIAVLGHELGHAVVAPGHGFSDMVYGFWPQMGSPYVQPLRPMTRDRFVVVAAAPGVLISILPLLAASMGVSVAPVVQWASVGNAVGAGADYLAVWVLLKNTAPRDWILDSHHGLYRHDAAR